MQLISIGAQCHLVVSVKPSHALHFHQLLECFQKYFVKWLKVWCCFSLCSVSGPLCAGVVGKKKKKMMYLTTKNAGNFIWALGKMIHYLVIFFILFYFFLSQFDLLLLPDQNLIVMSCGSTRRLPKSRPSGGRLWFWSELRVSAVVAWRTNCWCQIPNAMAPQSPVSKAIITRRHTHQ